MAKITYKMLHKTSPARYADNASCGLIRGGRRILGCGKHTRTTQFYYKDPKYGTISSVYLCPSCAKKA